MVSGLHWALESQGGSWIKIPKSVWRGEFSSHTHTSFIASSLVTSHIDLVRGLFCVPASVIIFTKQAAFLWCQGFFLPWS